MTIAVTAIGATLDDTVDDRFGRARFILIVSEDGELQEVIDNHENRNAMQGAGIATAELVAGQKVSAVITGHLGPKAFGALSTAGAKGYSGSGMTARDAVASFVAGELECLSDAGPAHAGM